jgi:signal transduction histidine kinase
MGVALIVVAVALTVAWQILAAPEAAREAAVGPARAIAYFFGSLLFLLLIAGLVLIVILLLREVRLNERQSNFVSAVTHELKTPVSSLKLYLDTLEYRQLLPERRAEFYKTMRQDIERLDATINNVLNAARYTDHPVADPRPSTSRASPGGRPTSPSPATSCPRRRSASRGRSACGWPGTPRPWRRPCSTCSTTR